MKKNEMQQDINHWKMGVIYFNRKDSRVLVPKRVPTMGWTLNFANPRVYLIIVAIASVIIGYNYLM